MLNLGTRSSGWLRERGGPGKSPEALRVLEVNRNSEFRSHPELRVPVLNRGDIGNTEFRVTSGTHCCGFLVTLGSGVSVNYGNTEFRVTPARNPELRVAPESPGDESGFPEWPGTAGFRSNPELQGVTWNSGLPETPGTPCSLVHPGSLELPELRVPGITRYLLFRATQGTRDDSKNKIRWLWEPGDPGDSKNP
jgi:hypothetical protein